MMTKTVVRGKLFSLKVIYDLEIKAENQDASSQLSDQKINKTIGYERGKKLDEGRGRCLWGCRRQEGHVEFVHKITLKKQSLERWIHEDHASCGRKTTYTPGGYIQELTLDEKLESSVEPFPSYA